MRRLLEINTSTAAAESPSATGTKKLLEEIAVPGTAKVKIRGITCTTIAASITSESSCASPSPPSSTRRESVAGMLPVGTILVVLLPLFGIAQDLVSLVDLLELLLGGLLVLGQIGVMLAGKLAEGTLDLVSRGGFGDPQGLVIIAELGSHGRIYS